MLSSIQRRDFQTNTMKAYRKQQQNFYHHCSLCHVTPSLAILVGASILMLPMLELAAECAQLTTMYYTNHFSHTHFLPSLNNVLPAIVLQNRVAWSNIKCLSYISSYFNVHHVSLGPAPTGLGMRVVGAVVLLLLLMSGDIEMNPGPVGECTSLTYCKHQVCWILKSTSHTIHQIWSFLDPSGNKLTLDDLGQVMEEVLDVSVQWYHLGVQLKVRTGTLDNIQAQFPDPKRQLLEMLKTWLTTSDNTSWKALTDALRSRSVGASQLAGVLETKYHQVEGTEMDGGTSISDSLPETSITPPPLSEQRAPIQQSVVHLNKG